MKTFFTTAFFLIALTLHAQDHLKVTNRANGKALRFSTNYLVFLNIEDDTALYSGWKIEKIGDSSMVITSPHSYYQNPYFQKTAEVNYSDISFVRFEHICGKETFFSSAGMLLGGFVVLISPFTAYNENTHTYNYNNMYTAMITGSATILTSFIVHKRLVKRCSTFDKKNWEFSPTHTFKKTS